jgi:Amt family ammonium transporter
MLILTLDHNYLGVISVIAFVFVVSLIIWKILAATVGIRVSKEAEEKGTDIAEIGVVAYSIRD